MPCKKAKILRQEKKAKKMQEKGATPEKAYVNNNTKNLEQLLNEISDDSNHKLKVDHFN